MDTNYEKQFRQKVNAKSQYESTTEVLKQVLSDEPQFDAKLENISIIEVSEEVPMEAKNYTAHDKNEVEKPIVKRQRKKIVAEISESVHKDTTVEAENKEKNQGVKTVFKTKDDRLESLIELSDETKNLLAEDKKEDIASESSTQLRKRRSGKKKQIDSEINKETPKENIAISVEKQQKDLSPLAIESQVKHYTLTQLVEFTESVLENTDFSTIKDSMLIIRNRFDEINNNYEQKQVSDNSVDDESTESQSDLVQMASQVEEFKKLLSKYSSLRKKHAEHQEAEKIRNYDLKKQILENLKQLVESEETLQKSWEDFKRLQQEWKEIGRVPPAQNQDLWKSFNYFVDLFLDKVKINRELRDLDCKKNLEAKLDICEKIEELLLVDSIEDAFIRLGYLQNTWREIGPVPSEKREEINQRFGNAIEKLKEKRQEINEGYRLQLEQNLEVKKALILKIEDINEEEITSAKAWLKKSEEVEELMKLWKNTGLVHKRQNEEVWAKFSQEMSKFYAEKKHYFRKIKDEFTENYNRKLLLCKQAESLQDSTDWKLTTQEFVALQNEWKTIGPVPHKYSDAIWKQFRAACDLFFSRKQEFFSNIDKTEAENLKIKNDIIEQMISFEFGEDNKTNLEAIKEFQRKFFEIGRVPIKEKDKMQSRFQIAVDELLDKLKIGKEEKRRFDIKQRYEDMNLSKIGKEEMKRESFAISSKINALESEIKLWENNIEFFAKSKNADLLMRDFRDKIDKAKAEVLVLKEKQKVLKDLM